MKTILGSHRELAGKIIWGAKTDIGYYSQQLEDLDNRNEIITELRRIAPLAENGALRSFLARFLFVGEDVFKRVADLSGGEKGRLALAKLIFSQKNVLVLDEPTNHLDIPSREALESALQSYEGTILTVSHDRFFLDEVSTQIFSFEENGKIEIFNGNYSEFHDWRDAENSKSKAQSQLKDEQNIQTVENEQITIDKGQLSKNQLLRIEQRVKEIETEIPRLEEKLSKLTLQMNAPEIVSSHEKLQKVSEKYEQTERQIKSLYAEWEDLLTISST